MSLGILDYRIQSFFEHTIQHVANNGSILDFEVGRRPKARFESVNIVEETTRQAHSHVPSKLSKFTIATQNC